MDQISEEILAEFPGFKIVNKQDSLFMRAIDLFLRVLTFNKMAAFMTSYVTTIGSTVYVPRRWTEWSLTARASILRHERVHMRQARRYGFVPFMFLYLCPFLPIGLAYFRARFEFEAYVETMRAAAEAGTTITSGPFKDHIIEQFVGPAYGWMWPFRTQVTRWYTGAALLILAERGRSEKSR
jgi:hypothetical protein